MRRDARAGLLALALLGLLFLVTLAARGGHPGSDGKVTPRAVPDTAQDTFVTLLAIAYVAAIVAVIVILFWGKGQWHEPKERHWLRHYVVGMLVIGAATLFAYIAVTHGYFKGKDDKAAGAGRAGQTQTRRNRQRDVPVREAHFQWPAAVGVVGLILLGGVVVYLRRRREHFGPVLPRSLEEDLADAVGATIDDLRAERDPRRAVVAAYAQMEGVLAAHGFRRRDADAPLEYLARILRELEVRESAVRELTELFEYARFSPHGIDAEMKERAIAALVAIHDDLRAGEAVAA
jgi:Domain of unknown function (DUF4129)